MSELISVIIPVYNSEKYLEECINSIVLQTYMNLEIICINDGSTDNSKYILDNYKKKDSRIKVINIENAGVSNARNIGINTSTGKYITFVDSDDFIGKKYIESLYYQIKRYDSDLAILPFISFKGGEKSINSFSNGIFEINNNNFFYKLIQTNLLYAPYNKIFKSEIIKINNLSFDVKFNFGEDLKFNFEYLEYCNTISFENVDFYYYRLENNNSLARKYREDEFINEKKLSKVIYDFLNRKKLYNKKFEEFLKLRLFDVAYNQVCRLDLSKQSYQNRVKKGREILKDPVLKSIYNSIVVDRYSPIIVFFMKHSLIRTLLYYQKISEILRKIRGI